MKRILLCLALCLFANGCSDSVSQSGQTYPLQLSVSNYNRPPGSLIESFTLQVSKNGTPLSGAKLTALFAPDGIFDTVTVNGAILKSDANGTLIFNINWGAESAVAFQAVKDSVVSNYVRF